MKGLPHLSEFKDVDLCAQNITTQNLGILMILACYTPLSIMRIVFPYGKLFVST